MRVSDLDVHEHRKPDHPIEAVFVERWSPRSMSAEPVGREELARLFEAARWAPSSYNLQPWRFLYAVRDTPPWREFTELLVEFNRSWADRAGALIVVASRETFEHNGEPARTHSFDTGAACENLALQGRLMGLVVHTMQGFDYERARTTLKVPDGVAVEAMIAVGRPGAIDDLPEALREREKPSGRKPIGEIAFEGSFPGGA